MKKQLLAVLTATAMMLSSLPMVSVAAEKESTPILHYTFDESNSTADVKGKNELKLNGGAVITDEGNKGRALLLDGKDGYAQLPKDILSEEMTISTWVKINKFTTWGRVFDFGTDANNNFFFAPYSGGSARVEMKSPAGVETMDCEQETEKEWVHYAVTVDNDTVSYYRNGRLIKSKSGIKQSVNEVKDELNYIGKSHYEGDAYLAAAVDDFRIYDTTLDTEEIRSVMAEGEINPEILLDSYSIEDGQIITGDKIDLPKIDGLYWNEIDNLGLVNVETGEVKHNENTEMVTLTATYGDLNREYTVYVTGTKENPYTININAADLSKDVSEIMWGLFFEDINSAADGGLYAELVQNRSFEIEDNEYLYSWNVENAKAEAKTENPMNENNPHYITYTPNTTGISGYIENDGFAGMSLKKGESYDFSIFTRSADTNNITVELIGDDNKAIGKAEIDADKTDGEWKKYSAVVVAEDNATNAKLRVTSQTKADFDMISLIPQDTYKGHGLRKDLMEKLEEMHPKFLRFPGGCAVEGQTMDKAWNWKDTIGDVSERKEMINIWSPSATEPYLMTYGLGFYEYFQMCEDIGMEAVPILNCGIACQVRSGSATDEEHLVPMDELQPYIDDAIDLIEFANGTDESNEWVQKRIQMGHKEPFNIKFIGIGNEQYGEIYFERYAEFTKQIHEKYPDIELVTTSGTGSSGNSNDLAWSWANENQEYADLMDEHYYETADWFRRHVYRYDNYRRDTNTKVFLGEYASKGNTWYNALSEAAYMTGLERNADVVRMASYAPMFAKYGNIQWSAANMIWFTNDDYMLTPNYYVQSLFSNSQGDYSLPTEVELNGIDSDDTLNGGISIGTWKTQAEFKDIKIVSGDGTEEFDFSDKWKAGEGEWTINEDGSISQNSDVEGAMYYIDTLNKSNYTLSLKAKKTGGKEGFLIGVALDDSSNLYWANIGGWSNTASKMQKVTDGSAATISNVAEQSYTSDVTAKEGEWQDIRVEVTDYEIKAYVDDTLACSYKKPKEYGPVYSSSVYNDETGEVIVKVVNTMDSSVGVGVNVDGVKVESTAKTTVMSGDGTLENTLENKTAIVPIEGEITNASNSFTYNAPAESLSIIRLSTSGKAYTPYISGYEDGTFKADISIKRAEAASILARISGYDENTTYQNTFADVEDNSWYKNYVGYVADKGYISGYDGGVFKPTQPITRAEFSVMVGKYIDVTPYDNEVYSDVTNDHWAFGYISVLSGGKIISGYENNEFKPDNSITRAEAVAILNRILDYDADKSDNAKNPFKDLTSDHWAYKQILYATASHQ